MPVRPLFTFRHLRWEDHDVHRQSARTVHRRETRCARAWTECAAFSLTLLVYGREHGKSPATTAHWLGSLFAPTWDEVGGQGAYRAVREAAMDIASTGATVQALSGDEQRSEVKVTGVPPLEMIGFFGLSQDDADAEFSVFAPIAERIGLQYRWQRQGDGVTMTFEQEPR